MIQARKLGIWFFGAAVFFPLQGAIGQVGSSDGGEGSVGSFPKEYEFYRSCANSDPASVKGRQENGEQCRRDCGVESLRYRLAAVSTILEGLMSSKNSPADPPVSSYWNQKLFGVHAKPDKAVLPELKILYVSERGRMYQRWLSAVIDTMCSNNFADSIARNRKDEELRDGVEVASDHACETIRQAQEFSGVKDRSEVEGLYADCMRLASHPVSYVSSSLRDDLANAQAHARGADAALARVQAEMKEEFPELIEAIRANRGDVAEWTVLKENIDFRYDTDCNGRCPS